ncbi:glycine cleavage system aminomethyltransferase GcvT [Ectothiorhodospira shaposhnikovii]|uniref:glycine cleavage system aminomethyltransferase GcvT n=1 Tax=Ectothiorhodospira shaposhnikovii TaxID=1054 RepID=UPI001EE7A33D|nr:glycine cleavage system aminomethyltransferase GcvT [Ectothiorhodospira shaposhnikovii]MCG5511604.1 glycine cleavage system aminomethyltransferase GcvT [Ectothiorhodospira shaposhnikovii]
MTLRRTTLHATHEAAGARMVDFAGWSMPVHYGSQIDEHHAVRRQAGMFDVSHMTVVDVDGPGARDYLRHLLANDVDKLKAAGRALYSCMLNPEGGVLDDLITYRRADGYRVVVNAATRDKDLAWMRDVAARLSGTLAPVEIRERDDLDMIAVQGPAARDLCLPLLPESLRAPAEALTPFTATEDGDWFVARTGYTGEDGFEVILPATATLSFWQALAAAGVRPIGLGARDTLRLEAGMNLYGTDMDEQISPLESGLGWTVAWTPADRDFIGRQALERQQADGAHRRLVGLVLEGRGVLRGHMSVSAGEAGQGETTSGSFSPTLGVSIALARIPADAGERVTVDIRGKLVPAKVVKPPFVRHGKALIDL